MIVSNISAEVAIYSVRSRSFCNIRLEKAFSAGCLAEVDQSARVVLVRTGVGSSSLISAVTIISAQEQGTSSRQAEASRLMRQIIWQFLAASYSD
jgi:hypothetical protein